MTRFRTIAVVTIALSLIIIGPVARATTIDECQAALDALKAQTGSVTILEKDAEKAAKEIAGLLGKLDGASVKLDQAKFCDVIQKVGDYRNKVDALVKAGQINTDPLVGITAEDLLNAANDVIDAASQLSAQSGGKC